jgi:putative Holliday junction resolvase
MSGSKSLIGLDVGQARIGVAVADTAVRIAVPFATIDVNGDELKEMARIAVAQRVDTIVVGYPRNQSGEPTAQTALVEDFAHGLGDMAAEIVFQDESLTSVMAEQRLKERGGTYSKADIDAEAAVIILQDYLESRAS